MSKVYLEDSTLTGIANAIRAKTGESASITPANMATEIESIPSGGEPIVVEGDLRYFDFHARLDSIIKKITFQNNYNLMYCFSGSDLEDLSSITIPVINVSNNNNLTGVFENCNKLKKLPRITATGNEITPIGFNYMFHNCPRLKEIPANFFDFIDITALHNQSFQISDMFYYCKSLRSIPSIVCEEFYTNYNRAYGFGSQASDCWSLDEILNQNCGPNIQITGDSSLSPVRCFRLQRYTFKLENGQPLTRNWRISMTIDMATNVGLASRSDYINFLNSSDNNSGITLDKEVTDAASYEALKNDPDWWTSDVAYSRYNHTSAVETINTLPIMSNTSYSHIIKFKGIAGSSTDGGAINTLTAAETAVATDKGWTVTLV